MTDSKRKTGRARRAGGRNGRDGRKATRGTAVMHVCGHMEERKLSVLKWKRESEIKWYGTQVCRKCWSNTKAEDLEAFCGVEPGLLPEIKGTDRQIQWARSIRASVLVKVEREAVRMDRERIGKGLPAVASEYKAMVVPRVLREDRAKWWIDHREDDSVLDKLLDQKSRKGVAKILSEMAVVDLPHDAPNSDFCPF